MRPMITALALSLSLLGATAASAQYDSRSEQYFQNLNRSMQEQNMQQQQRQQNQFEFNQMRQNMQRNQLYTLPPQGPQGTPGLPRR